jgi:hypothetical protein
MTKHIRVIAGDRGGWNAIEPVVQRAVSEGHTVAAYFVGTCEKQYVAGDLKLPPEVMVKHGHYDHIQRFVSAAHDITLIGASQSDEGAIAATHAMDCTEQSVFLIEDYYGSAIPALKQALPPAQYKVKVCVVDRFAQDKICRADLFVEQIIITGGPHFDKFVPMKRNWEDHRQCLREAMGVRDDDIVALIAGQLSGTAESLLLFTQAMQKLEMLDKARVVLRTHPRAKWPDQSLLEYCRRALPERHYVEVDSELAQTSEDYLPGVNFVLSGYGTANYAAILCQMPGVVYVGTPSHRYEYYREKNPEVSLEEARPIETWLNAAWYAQHPEELAEIIRRVQAGDIADIKKSQHIIAAANDGHATDRVYDLVMKYAGAR